MGLNDVHLELEINRTAAPQRDSASYAADGQEDKSTFFQPFNKIALKDVCLAA